MINIKEYKICQKRGHTSSGTTLSSNPPWNVCKYCGVAYRFETNLIEAESEKIKKLLEETQQ